MKFTFTGVPGEDIDEITMYGYSFPKGQAVTVTDPHAQMRLARHPHFKGGKNAPTSVVTPQDIPVVKATHLVSQGTVGVTDIERDAINADPRMAPGAQVSHEQILEAKENHGFDSGTGSKGAAKADGAKPGTRSKS